jgi:hypothetical protein
MPAFSPALEASRRLGRGSNARKAAAHRAAAR